MKTEKFSIIVTTNRDIEALKPLFVITDDKSELIIVDKSYNKKTKEWLGTQSGYEKIVYSPVKESPVYHTRNFSQGLNTALMFSENKWIVKADDSLEFRDNFFVNARENIENFTEMLPGPFALIGRKLWASAGHKRWVDPSPGPTARHTEIVNPGFTFSFGLYPITAIYALNGYDERYDVSWGYDDHNFLYRLLVANHKVFYDKELMAFSENHKPQYDSIMATKLLYEMEIQEINFGKVHAFNPFSLKEMQQEFLAKKDTFVIKK